MGSAVCGARSRGRYATLGLCSPARNSLNSVELEELAVQEPGEMRRRGHLLTRDSSTAGRLESRRRCEPRANERARSFGIAPPLRHQCFGGCLQGVVATFPQDLQESALAVRAPAMTG